LEKHGIQFIEKEKLDELEKHGIQFIEKEIR
jgi:hypothetical protein